jgi:hypothetical protein
MGRNRSTLKPDLQVGSTPARAGSDGQGPRASRMRHDPIEDKPFLLAVIAAFVADDRT